MQSAAFAHPSYRSSPERAAAEQFLSGMQDAIERVKQRQKSELARMRKIGLKFVHKLDLSAARRLSPEEEALFAHRSRGIIRDFATMTRAIRQILVLEQELDGIRPARRDRKAKPDRSAWRHRQSHDRPGSPRDNLHEYYDYRPVGEAVGWIRETLSLDAPPDDPFMVTPRKSAAKPAKAAPPDPESQPSAEPAASPKPPRATHIPAANFSANPGDESVLTSPRHGLPPRGPP